MSQPAHYPASNGLNGIALFDPGLALFTALVAPILLYMGGLATIDRFLYPTASLIVAGYLYFKRSSWYIGFCLWLFCATPLVRRLADEQAGWDPSNPILLAPYIACAFTIVSVIRYRSRGATQVTPFLLMLLCIGYGLLLAILGGRTFSGIVDSMKWSVGPLLAVHILAHFNQRQRFHRVAVISFLVAGPAMAAYGIAQYINPPPWDRDWMVGAASLGLNSIGRPAPFELRVFSTMNSPGSFAIMLTTAILISLQQRRFFVVVPELIVMALGLLLSQYRAIWAGTMLGVVCLLVWGSAITKLRVVFSVTAMILLAGSLTIMPEIRQAITDRLQTLTQLGSDASGEDRLHQYERFWTDPSEDIVVGQGLAINGALGGLDHRNPSVIDSGIIVTFSVFGIFCGTIFTVGMLWAVGLTFTQGARECLEMPLYRAIAIATFCQFPFGDVHVGESGFGAWMFVGLAAAEIAARANPNISGSIQVARA
jgi:hypothetical protein